MTLARLVSISRPRFWLYEAGTFAVGAAAALARGGGAWDWTLLPWFLYFLIPANLLIYGVNDVFDYETDRRNPKKQGYEGLLPRSAHRRVLAAAALSTAAFLPLLFLAPQAALLPFGLFLLGAVFYSAPPIRAKAVPGLDMLFSATHYVATGWFGYALALGTGVPYAPLLAGLAWAMAMHAYSAVPDIAADEGSGLRTVATALGARRTLLLCAGLYAAAGALAFPSLGYAAPALLAPYLVLVAATLPQVGNEEALMRRYRTFPYLNAIVGALIWWLVVLGR